MDTQQTPLASAEVAHFYDAVRQSRRMFGIRVYLMHGIYLYPEHTPCRLLRRCTHQAMALYAAC